jgi:hypothetical protein
MCAALERKTIEATKSLVAAGSPVALGLRQSVLPRYK